MWVAMSRSYYEEFLNGLAEQMNQAPSGLDNPYMARLMEQRHRMNQAEAMRNKIAPGPSRGDTMALLEGLGRIYGGGASLALTGQTNPLEALQGLIGSTRGAKEDLLAGRADPLQAGISMIPMRGQLHKGHGAEVREQLLAKRAAKGPRKPGGGRRPAPKAPPEPASPTPDLTELLAASVARPQVSKKSGGISALLNRLGRRGGR
jgi:hypothetical protein